jgi:hypothetical protein
MATADQIQACIVELRKWLAGLGFEVGSEKALWQAVAVSVGSINADRLLGVGVTLEVQLQSCNAIRTTMSKMTAEQLRGLTFEQRKRLSPPGPSGGGLAAPIIVGTLSVAAIGFGLYLALRS